MTLQSELLPGAVRIVALLVGLGLLLSSTNLSAQIPSRANSSVIRQSNPLTCGPAAVATLLTFYYGDPSSEEEILRLAGLTVRGASLEGLQTALLAKRYQAEAYPMTLEMLLKEVKATPLIALFEDEVRHYVLVIGRSGDYLLIADPARGEVLIHTKDFQRRWTVSAGDLRYGSVLIVKSTRPLNKLLIERRKTAATTRLRTLIRAATWTDGWQH